MKINKKIVGLVIAGVVAIGIGFSIDNTKYSDEPKKEVQSEQVTEKTENKELNKKIKFESVSNEIKNELEQATTGNMVVKLGYDDSLEYVAVVFQLMDYEFTLEEIKDHDLLTKENERDYQKLTNTLKEKYAKNGFDVNLTLSIDDKDHHLIKLFEAE